MNCPKCGCYISPLLSDCPACGYKKGSQRATAKYTSPPRSSKTPTYSKGDTVAHRLFGVGVVTSVSPLGDDYAVDVAFSMAGNKRLMQKASGRLMGKMKLSTLDEFQRLAYETKIELEQIDKAIEQKINRYTENAP